MLARRKRLSLHMEIKCFRFQTIRVGLSNTAMMPLRKTPPNVPATPILTTGARTRNISKIG